MSSELFDFAIIPISLGVSGLIFLGIAFFLRHRYRYKGGVKTVGTLVGFKIQNAQDRKPILRFMADGYEVECQSEWSVGDLGKDDIGRKLPIQYFCGSNGFYRVILEGKQYDQQRNRGRKVIFWVFAGIGVLLIFVSILVIVTFG